MIPVPIRYTIFYTMCSRSVCVCVFVQCSFFRYVCSFHIFLLQSSSWSICYYSSGVSACYLDLCDLITAYNKLHIHAIRHEFITNVDDAIFFFLLLLLIFFASSERQQECGIIIRAAKSVDNLQRIVIQNGQPLLIKHCPKCRVRKRNERKKDRTQQQQRQKKNIIAYTITVCVRLA